MLLPVPKHPLAGKVLAGIGVGVVLLDVVLRTISWITSKPWTLDHTIIIVGAIIGFTGFWILNSQKTKEGVEVLTDIIRFGRRKTDAVATPETITHTVPIPTGEHAVAKVESAVIVQKTTSSEEPTNGGA